MACVIGLFSILEDKKWTAPQKLDRKNLTFGDFIMKLSYKDKVHIYELRKQGQSFKQLSKRFGVDIAGLKYMVTLIDCYGIEIVKKGKNRYCSPELKREIMDKVLLEGRSQRSVSLDYGLPNQGMLPIIVSIKEIMAIGELLLN